MSSQKSRRQGGVVGFISEVGWKNKIRGETREFEEPGK
jgi:hypothetical protein